MTIDLQGQQRILKLLKEADSVIIIAGWPQGKNRTQNSFIKGRGEDIFTDLYAVAKADKMLVDSVHAVSKALNPAILKVFALSSKASNKIALMVMAEKAETALQIIKAQLVGMEEKELADKITVDSLVEMATGTPCVLAAIKFTEDVHRVNS